MLENLRIGLGQDSHALIKKNSKINKQLILGGVEISQQYYCEADSDGDVVIHSLCNAISTAIGGGSLDTFAGPLYRKHQITDSTKFLQSILDTMTAQNFQIINTSIMIEALIPKLESKRILMQKSLSQLLSIPATNIGLAFTTGEQLTAFGKGQGIQALSNVLLYQKI